MSDLVVKNAVFVKQEEEEGRIQIWNAFLAFSLSFALKAAVELEIPDILAKPYPSGLTLEEIAEELPSKSPNKDYLCRIMDYLVSHKIFSWDGGKYSLNLSSKWLVKGCLSSPFWLEQVCIEPWIQLSQLVLGAADSDATLFKKLKGETFWEYASHTPSLNKMFNEAMATNSEFVTQAILKHYQGFKDIKVLADVGGGIGLVVSKIVQAYPGIRGINFDQPHVIDSASPIAGVEHIGGDMFQSVPSADAIILKWILHDWNDESCLQILRNCHSALPHNGKLIIVDMVLDLSKEKGEVANMKYAFDLGMLVMLGGKERSIDEWHALLPRAGFPSIKIHDIPNRPESIIEAFKL